MVDIKAIRKPQKVEAVQYSLDTGFVEPDLPWLIELKNSGLMFFQCSGSKIYSIKTAKGEIMLGNRSWLIRDENGEVRTMSNDAFRATYDLV